MPQSALPLLNTSNLFTVTNTWYTITTPDPIPPARDMASITVVGTSAYLFGGYNGRPLEDMWIFRLVCIPLTINDAFSECWMLTFF